MQGRKRPFNTTITPEVLALLDRYQDFGFRSAGDMICASVQNYAQSYQDAGDFHGTIIRALAREEATKLVAKLGIELREHVDELFASRMTEAPVNQHQVNVARSTAGIGSWKILEIEPKGTPRVQFEGGLPGAEWTPPPADNEEKK